ncbi:2-hydroxyacid dehydrogenase [Caldimonas brevitalea]|uniref:2-hydroxyacid dehydrogenase n=1 Tax=Caldimonas brevitalea TaxID=413882 RepID=A0A0G3BH89_9BURK|nr:D-glycerate dehydrogenase [Caldimonas brevitalea]AKJ28732.1 2-hydroxyacid dehydrogenase [Caldimonas brevitalea]
MKPKVLVTRKVFPEVLERLAEHFELEVNELDRPWTADELRAHLQGKQGMYLTPTNSVDAALLDACPDLKVVANMAVGYNNIDVPACTAHGVLCTNTPGVLTESTADFGFALMLAAARRLTESERFLRSGQWANWSFDMMMGREVHATTLGVFGMGRIGQAIARRASLGFGMQVIYHNRSRLPAELEEPIKARYVGKEQLLRECDHLMVVVPYSAETHHAIGAAELALMKRTATLTNIARGGVVDDAALAEALKERRLAAAGLDVFEGEPHVHPALLELPNAVLTPHVASATVRTRRAMAGMAADNLIAGMGCGPLAGRPPSPLNPEVLATRA